MAKKIQLVYTGGYYGNWRTTYGNCKTLATCGATDFVLTTAWGFNYGSASASSEIVSTQWVTDNIKYDGRICEATDKYTVDEFILKPLNENLGKLTSPAGRLNYTDFAADMVELAKLIIAQNSSARIWFALPPFVEGGTCCASLYTAPYKAYIVDKVLAGMSAYMSNVEGFYFAQEDLPLGVTRFETSYPSAEYNSVVCQCMRDMRAYITSKNSRFKFLWIPYLDPGADYQKKNGYITNKKDYFDIVILQPAYYFTPAMSPNIDFAKKCAQYGTKGAYLQRTGSGVEGGSKTSNVEVGIHIELDQDILKTDDRQYLTRFEAYASAYGPMRGQKYSFGCYAGGDVSLMNPGVMIRVQGFWSV